MKRLNTLFRALILASVITGCSSRIQQPLMQTDFNNSVINSTQVSATGISKRADYRKQDISIKMDRFYPEPEQGMKWTYDYKREYGDHGIGAQVDISIESLSNKYVNVSVSGQTMRFDRPNFWYEFNLYLIRVFHNKNFAEFPGKPFDDHYTIYRHCSGPADQPPTSCGGYEVEIPLGKYIVEKLIVQEASNPAGPDTGNNLTWNTSHFWVNDKTGLIEMKLESPEKPELGTTTFTLVKTNIQ